MTKTGMTLNTPRGMTTWERGQSRGTIDLSWVSTTAEHLITYCSLEKTLEASSDHLPIRTSIQHNTKQRPTTLARPCWGKANWEAMREFIKDRLHQETTGMLTTREEIDQMIAHLTQVIQEAIEMFVPKTKPGQFAKPYWTAQCTGAVKAARKARRNWTERHDEESWTNYIQKCQEKKTTIRRAKTIGWRATVAQLTEQPQSMWRLAKWARSDPTQGQANDIPAIQSPQGMATSPREKAAALAANFFPEPIEADLSDIQPEDQPERTVNINQEITEADVQEVFRKLPRKKAPGPDKIPNEILKECTTQLSPTVTRIFNACLQMGYHPKAFKQSITFVLRKPQKEDYSKPKSYRPIALLNTLGKALEKIVANRLSEVAEAENLLPETQMGARRERSTLTAMELITSQVKTIWNRDNRMVASLLSLDISGAFDYVSHPRLIHILHMKGIPKWTTNFIASFLTDRTTSVLIGQYSSPTQDIATGIPQGSTLAPILFLFFMANILPALESTNTSASGFVDDTNILTWSTSTEENCRKLEQQHRTCEKWARTHGARFAPEKYNLIHFSRKRKGHNMTASITIQGHITHPAPQLRILGLWVDPKLKWSEHLRITAEKAHQNMLSVERLTASTWGASFHKTKQLYQAVVRPVLVYGSQVWSLGENTAPPPRQIKAIAKVQNKCLRKIAGAFKSTPTRVLERETDTPPLHLYIAGIRTSFSYKTRGQPAQHTIQKAIRKIQRNIPWQRGRSKQTPDWRARDVKTFEAAGNMATIVGELWDKEWEKSHTPNQGTRRHPRSTAQLPPQRLPDTNAPHPPIDLHIGLSKAQSSLTTQLRSGHIGLQSYLAWRKVPDQTKQCPCGYRSQNVRHILFTCPEWTKGRSEWLAQASTRNVDSVLNNPKDVRNITQWIIDNKWISQFNLAKETQLETDKRKNERAAATTTRRDTRREP